MKLLLLALITVLSISGEPVHAGSRDAAIKDGPNRICPGAGDYLVILHGWTAGYDNMRAARAHFSKAGYHVVCLRYPTRTAEPEDLLENYILPGIAKHCTDPERKIHFLTHSLGGVLLRDYLKDDRPENLGRGVMLAPPHRETALELVDELTETARVSGSVNCLQLTDTGLLGHNTEGASLKKLAEQTTYLEGSSVVILGGGRWARSIAAEMALAGVEELTLVYQDVEPLQEFVNELVEQTPLANCFVAPWPAGEPLEIPENCSLLVNATKIGRMAPQDPLPITTDSLSPSVTVADVVFNPTETWLLRQAAQHDCPTIDGLTLLVEQAAAAFEIWTGQDADREAMRDAVEEFLAV